MARLIDTLIHTMKMTAGDEFSDTLAPVLEQAQKYLFDKQALTMAAAVMSKLGTDLTNIRFPCGLCWFEEPNLGEDMDQIAYLWVGNLPEHMYRWGNNILLKETKGPEDTLNNPMDHLLHGSQTEGALMIFKRKAGTKKMDYMSCACELTSNPAAITIPDPIRESLLTMYDGNEEIVKTLIATAAWWAFSMAVILNSPKIHYVERTNFAKLNKKRARSGKPAFAEMDEVKLRIPLTPAIRQQRGPDTGDHSDESVKKRLHFVAPFVRVRLGRVEHVSAHFRGDETVGIMPMAKSVIGQKRPKS